MFRRDWPLRTRWERTARPCLRGGTGLFYDRTGPGPIFDLERYNGVRLRQVVLTNPSYPVMLDPAGLAAMPTTITRLDPTVRLPYLAQFSIGLERQIRKGSTLTFTYWATRGVGLFRSRDVNAPPPPDYAARPDPAVGVYRRIESSGHLQNDALEVSFRGRLTRYFHGMIQYTLGRSYNDVPGNYSVSTRGAGINAFPANNYDLSGEWSRADYDRRHRLNLLGTVHAAKYVDFGVGLVMNTAHYDDGAGHGGRYDSIGSSLGRRLADVATSGHRRDRRHSRFDDPLAGGDAGRALLHFEGAGEMNLLIASRIAAARFGSEGCKLLGKVGGALEAQACHWTGTI
jgi:hypothetical protein